MKHRNPIRFSNRTVLKVVLGVVAMAGLSIWLAGDGAWKKYVSRRGRQPARPAAADDQELDRLLEAAAGRRSKISNRQSPQSSKGAAGRINVKTVSRLPRTSEELAEAFTLAAGYACEPIPAGEPLEIANFTPFLTARDQVSPDGTRPLPSSRHSVLSIGLEISDSDRSSLPTLSRGRIIDYLHDHYLAVQVRVQRDTRTNELFLHHRPLATTALFGRQALTQEFSETVASAARDLHAIGVLVQNKAKPTPENLRMLAMVHKCTWSTGEASSGKPQLQARYEYVFIRARTSASAPLRELELHIFVTDQERQRLHYLPPFEQPGATAECGIRATVFFTDYTHANLYPAASAIRASSVRSKTTYTWPRLNEYVRSQDWTGDTFDNITGVVDAIIDGKLTP